MKIVNLKEKLAACRCPNFRHLSLFTVLSVLSFSAFSLEYKVANSRSPASAFDEEVLTVPLEQKVMIQSLFAEDDAGVMKGMRDSLSSWQDIEDYAQRWDLQSTHLYNTPTTKEKTKYITKNLLRYSDKRLAGEMKNAEEGSTLHTVGKVEKSLRPNASVPISRYVSLKFKVRVLQGKAIMDVKNPWIECNATVGANGKAKILTKKDFNQLGTSSGVEYNVNEAQWIAFVDQEITKNIKARMSSTSMPNGVDADKRLELTASFPFNL
jgi:hypothetical protein